MDRSALDPSVADAPRVYRAGVFGNVAVLRWEGRPSVAQNELLMRDLRHMRARIGDEPAIAACVLTPDASPPDFSVRAAIELYKEEFLGMYDSLHVVLEGPADAPDPVAVRRFTELVDTFVRYVLEPGAERLCINVSLLEAIENAAVPSRWPAMRVVAEARDAGLVQASYGRDLLRPLSKG